MMQTNGARPARAPYAPLQGVLLRGLGKLAKCVRPAHVLLLGLTATLRSREAKALLQSRGTTYLMQNLHNTDKSTGTVMVQVPILDVIGVFARTVAHSCNGWCRLCVGGAQSLSSLSAALPWLALSSPAQMCIQVCSWDSCFDVYPFFFGFVWIPRSFFSSFVRT